MKRVLLALVIMLIGGVAFAATDKDVENWLKNHEEEGYEFKKTVTEGKMWKVAFKLPDWEKSWDVYVVIGKNKNNSNFDMVTLFAGVGESESQPSTELMKYVLDVNASDDDWGAFSVYYDKSDKMWYVDYNIHLRKMYVNSTELINAVGWMAGTCESYASVIADKI